MASTPRTRWVQDHPAKFKEFLMRQKVILLVTFVGYVCAYLVRNNFKLMSDDMTTTYGWDIKKVSILLTCFTVTYGVGKFVMGVVADRMSLKLLFGGSLALAAIGCIAMGFTKNFWIIAALLLLVGLIQGALAPSSQAMIANYYPNTTRGAAIAGWNVSQNFGGALLPVIITGLGFIAPNNIALAFIVPGVLVLAISFFVWKYGGDNPESDKFGTLIDMYGKEGEPDVGENSKSDMPYWQLIRKYVFLNPGLLLVGLINAALYFVRFGVEDWMPIYLGQVAGFSKPQYLMAVSVLEWVAIPGSLIFAWLSVKYPNKMTIIGAIGLFLMGGLIFYYETIHNTGTFSYVQLLIVSGILGTLIYGPQLIVNILTLNFVPLKVAGTALGLVGLMAYLLGNLGSNWLMPIIAKHISWGYSYAIVAALSVLSGLGYILLSRKEKAAVSLDDTDE